MAMIQPLAGIRYSTRASPDLSTRLSPPYDVIDESQKQALLARDPANFVRIDLPFLPAKKAGPPEVYEAAARQMQAWLRDGTLVRDTEPALYVYHQHFEHEGRRYVRRMFLARLRLEPFGTGQVFPHEQTFAGPKEDRLMLTRATGANLSAIFALYSDPEQVIAGRLEPVTAAPPLCFGTLEGVENRLWAARDPSLIDEVQRLMQPRPVFIADGHHRYGTSLMYREGLSQQRGKLPPDHPAHFVLCALCAMEDPGLLILPTHRVLPGVALTADDFRPDSELIVQPLELAGPEEVLPAIRSSGPQTVVLFSSRTQSYCSIRPKDPDLLYPLEPNHSPAWRRLALAFLHSYLLERRVASRRGGRLPEIHYVKSASLAVQEACESGGSAFLMAPTTIEELRAVCQAGDLMPQKSTYFSPKLASGLVINPLTE